MGDMRRHIYEFGPFRVDVHRRLLLREGRQLRLPAKAFEILLVLLEEPGRVVGKDELLQRVWPDAVVEENNLTVNVSALRKSLGESPQEHRYLLTIPGRGYQFVADVRQSAGAPAREAEEKSPVSRRAGVFAGPPQAVAALPNGRAGDLYPTPSAKDVGDESKRHKHGALLVLAALLATTLVAAYFAYPSRPAAGGKAGISSLAVLPFANRGNDPNAEYLSDGISESLINILSQLPGLKVIAASSSFRYKGTDVDVQEVAQALGVEAVVTGRVSQRGDELIINVELVDARDKTQMWGEQYTRKATDLLAMQSEMSREIAEKLRLRLSASERQHLARRETSNPLAYELLLRGRFNFNKGADEARKNAVDYYNQAIAIDPNYAPAYAELAYAYSILGNDGVIDPKEAVLKAEAAAVRALELDGGLAEAHQALAYNKQLAWDWAGAEREYQRAVGVNPNYAQGYASYSVFLSMMGRHEEAIAEARRAKELDPLSIRIDIWVFNTLFFARRYDEAREVLKQMRELDAHHPLILYYVAQTSIATGQYTEAIAAYKEGIKLGDDTASTRIYLGHAYARAGQLEKARAILDELQRTKQYVSPAELAVLYVGLGEREQAFASLERAYAAHDLQLQYLGVDPTLDPLRSDPRFAELMRRVGLSQ